MAVLFVGVDVVEGVEGVAGEDGGQQLAGPTVHQTDPGLPDASADSGAKSQKVNG